MKYYDGGKIDAQGRINIGGIIKERKIVFYIVDNCDDVVYIEAYNSSKPIPRNAIRSIDNKGRVILPKWLRKDYNRILIGCDGEMAVIRLLKDS